MITTIVVDDDEKIRTLFTKKLNKRYPEKLEVIAAASSVQEAVRMINEMSPELVFLDFYLGDGTAFDILDAIDPDPAVILLTASDEHGIEALNRGILHYLQKPVNNGLLDQAVQKITSLAADKKSADPYVVLRTSEGIYRVHHTDIVYCQSEGNYSTFHTRDDNKVIISKPSKYAGALLHHPVFLRISQSLIVNTDYITLFDKEGYIHLSNEEKLRPSHRHKAQIKDLLS